MKDAVIAKLEEGMLKSDLPEFEVGDTLKIHTKIVEGNKERIQIFEGTCMGREGSGPSERLAIHRVAYGTGMERVFLVHSPRVVKIEIMKKGRVRRAKLYYLRGKQGKQARIQSRIQTKAGKEKTATVAAAE